jgi:hypothetical protein
MKDIPGIDIYAMLFLRYSSTLCNIVQDSNGISNKTHPEEFVYRLILLIGVHHENFNGDSKAMRGKM